MCFCFFFKMILNMVPGYLQELKPEKTKTRTLYDYIFHICFRYKSLCIGSIANKLIHNLTNANLVV